MTLGRIVAELEALVDQPYSASERLRRIYRTVLEKGYELYFNERKLHEIVTAAVGKGWSSVVAYKASLKAIVRRVLIAGREAGEFERKTPLDDLCAAVHCTLFPFAHPILLEEADPGDLRADVEQVSSLVLRSLAP
jgi:hypothetical protein